MKKLSLFLLFALTTILPMIAQTKKPVTNSSRKLVKTNNGIVEGVMERSGVYSYKGIPFAAPPVGDLRWKEPQPSKNWKGVLKADKFSAKPMQTNVFGDMNSRSTTISEDCLYLNIWAPAKKGNSLLPVLVYYYGGGFVAGDAAELRYDGESMAKKGIVALTVNYRLGVFGFLSHPEITKESPHQASGNYGLLDQAAALQWVQKNIEAFGGDPKRVTIAGESAGSVSVSALMASPLSKKLIAGAIGESGSILGALPAVPLTEGEQTGVRFAKSVNANSLSELRAMNADTLLKTSSKFGLFNFARTIDGYFFPKNPYDIFEKGEQAHVPLLVGWNNEEMTYRMIMGADKPNKENFVKAVQKLYGEKSDQFLKLYNPATDDEVEQVATDLASDRFIAYSTWKWADLQTKTGGKQVFRYIFERPRPEMTPKMGEAAPGLAGGIQKGAPKPPPAKGAVHSAEIEYAMGNLATNKIYAWKPEDYKVSQVMQEYFANFIKKGNPNGAGLPAWPATTVNNDVPVMHIDIKTRLQTEQHRDRYLLMDQNVKR
ncbi:MAG TPA: carboxylesterase family protein [Chitinophagaceae bacterium]|nr:carboxylesterase family protein [Chitinophagaceae bacterium]